MIAFLVALLLWALGHGPAPVPTPMHGVTVSAPAPASVVVRGDEPRTPGRHPGVGEPPAAAPTVAAPAPNGEELEGPVMCTDPVSCPSERRPAP